MKIRTLNRLEIEDKTFQKHATIEVTDEVAKDLIAGGRAIDASKRLILVAPIVYIAINKEVKIKDGNLTRKEVTKWKTNLAETAAVIIAQHWKGYYRSAAMNDPELAVSAIVRNAKAAIAEVYPWEIVLSKKSQRPNRASAIGLKIWNDTLEELAAKLHESYVPKQVKKDKKGKKIEENYLF